MHIYTTLLRLVCFTLVVIAGIFCAPLFAQADDLAPLPAAPPAPAANLAPNPAANPVLASYLKLGARLFFLGNRSGLNGWFVLRGRDIQVAYTTADEKTIIVGSMWDVNGQNVTNAQYKNLIETNKEVAAVMNGIEQNIPTATASLPPQIAAVVAKDRGLSPAVPAGPSPGEKLMADLQTLAGVTVGSSSAPLLMMVMDPNCPHCQATWKALHDAVLKNTVQVRLIPVANPDSDNERAAAQLLHVADPLNAWDRYVGGDKTQLTGTPPQEQIIALRANHLMTDSWRIAVTPTLVYRGKEGKVKIVQGEPDDIATVLNDLAP